MGTVNESITINATLDSIWQKIKDFHNVDWAKGVLETCEAVGDKGGEEVGAKRILNGAIHETLLECNNDSHIIRYSIDDGPPPISKDDISNYEGTIALTEVNGAVEVSWSSKWEGMDTACSEFCGPIYTALLGQLKNSLES